MDKVNEKVLVKAQNVWEYARKYGTEHGWDDLKTFVCSRLPFEKMVVTWDEPYSENAFLAVGKTHFHVGILMEELEPEAYITWLERNTLDRQNAGAGVAMLLEMHPYRIINMSVFLDSEATGVLATVGVDEQGKVLSIQDNLSYLLSAPAGWIQKEADWEWTKNLAARVLMVSMATVNFMNCRNVEVIDNKPTRQQRRAAERAGKKPPVAYKTLVIHQVGQRRLRTSSGGVNSEQVVSLHICRGHFKDYRQGAGLGRWKRHGVWWWSPQVRGRVEHGKVVKDYEVCTR